ncbi:hypothetical protein [Pseudomonas sp. PDM13]|nr:hypothetical protein [Pseudomonas sp. PDM13]MCU9950568.1 hypothetical protein [Pseudomonas sp. PDM13]
MAFVFDRDDRLFLVGHRAFWRARKAIPVGRYLTGKGRLAG